MRKYRCYKCDKLINNGEGHVQISWEDYSRFKQQDDHFRQISGDSNGFISAKTMVAFCPKRMNWYSVHTKCEPEGEFYAIPVEDLRSSDDLLEAVEHLIEKDWFLETDFKSLTECSE